MPTLPRAALLAAALAISACGGSKSGPPPRPPGNRTIQISWDPSHERNVNAPGGGYLVSIDGGTAVDLPWVSGAFAPTSITTTLFTGPHSVTVRAYTHLDVNGGTGLTLGGPSLLTIQVP